MALLRSSLRAPVHAYLLLGPHGSGKRATAVAFAAGLLSAESSPPDAAVEPWSWRSPSNIPTSSSWSARVQRSRRRRPRRSCGGPVAARWRASRKVLVLDEFHLVSPAAASKLLKTIEEPPAGTFFLVLAEEVTPDLVTIASALRAGRLASLLGRCRPRRADRGGSRTRAAPRRWPTYAEGDLGRARLLATDPRLAIRLRVMAVHPRTARWQGLDGRRRLVDEIRANIDSAEAPLRAASSGGDRGAERADRTVRTARVWHTTARRAAPPGAAEAPHRRAPARD